MTLTDDGKTTEDTNLTTGNSQNMPLAIYRRGWIYGMGNGGN